MKLLFESLDALLDELRDRKTKIVRVSPALHIEVTPRTGHSPQLVGRVLVTAALDDHAWAEWRHWVGQAAAEPDRPELHVPAWLRQQRDRALAEVASRVDAAGFLVREGILTHDTGVMDTFHL